MLLGNVSRRKNYFTIFGQENQSYPSWFLKIPEHALFSLSFTLIDMTEMLLTGPLNYSTNICLSLFAHSTKVSKKANIRNWYNQVPHLTQDSNGKVTKTTENITHKKAKRLALFQQVTTRLQWTDKKAWQTRNINNKKNPQKKHIKSLILSSDFIQILLIFYLNNYLRQVWVWAFIGTIYSMYLFIWAA